MDAEYGHKFQNTTGGGCATSKTAGDGLGQRTRVRGPSSVSSAQATSSASSRQLETAPAELAGAMRRNCREGDRRVGGATLSLQYTHPAELPLQLKKKKQTANRKLLAAQRELRKAQRETQKLQAQTRNVLRQMKGTPNSWVKRPNNWFAMNKRRPFTEEEVDQYLQAPRPNAAKTSIQLLSEGVEWNPGPTCHKLLALKKHPPLRCTDPRCWLQIQDKCGRMIRAGSHPPHPCCHYRFPGTDGMFQGSPYFFSEGECLCPLNVGAFSPLFGARAPTTPSPKIDSTASTSSSPHDAALESLGMTPKTYAEATRIPTARPDAPAPSAPTDTTSSPPPIPMPISPLLPPVRPPSPPSGAGPMPSSGTGPVPPMPPRPIPVPPPMPVPGRDVPTIRPRRGPSVSHLDLIRSISVTGNGLFSIFGDGPSGSVVIDMVPVPLGPQRPRRWAAPLRRGDKYPSYIIDDQRPFPGREIDFKHVSGPQLARRNLPSIVDKLPRCLIRTRLEVKEKAFIPPTLDVRPSMLTTATLRKIEAEPKKVTKVGETVRPSRSPGARSGVAPDHTLIQPCKVYQHAHVEPSNYNTPFRIHEYSISKELPLSTWVAGCALATATFMGLAAISPIFGIGAIASALAVAVPRPSSRRTYNIVPDWATNLLASSSNTADLLANGQRRIQMSSGLNVPSTRYSALARDTLDCMVELIGQGFGPSPAEERGC